MYSGWLLTNRSGALIGVHQRIDRVARRHLKEMTDSSSFPKIKHILHFEGKNGPDGIKAKSPANDEPWHYYDPFDPEDSQLIDLIEDHYGQLVDALRTDNYHRISFEASWLAHALVDGLTPAHHYPYEEELEKLRGEGKETRDSFRKKVIIPGDTKRKMVVNNWKMWGPKGLFITHGLFEMGIALIMAPMRFHLCKPNDYDIKILHEIGIVEFFRRKAREVALMEMYENYYKKGWTSKLARQVRDELVPIIIQTVTLAWYSAMYDADLIPAATELSKPE